MKLKSWSSCGGCGGGDEEEVGDQGFGEEKMKKRIRNEKEKIIQDFGFAKVMQLNNREGLNCKVEG